MEHGKLYIGLCLLSCLLAVESSVYAATGGAAKDVAAKEHQEGKNETSTIDTSRIGVEIDGVAMAGVQAIRGPEATVIGTSNAGVSSVSTQVKVVLTRLLSTHELFTWWKATSDGKVDRRSLSIIEMDSAGNEYLRTNAYNCQPDRWDFIGGNPNKLLEKVEIVCGAIEIKSLMP